MRWLVAIVVLVGCKEGDGALYPINPGGGTNPGAGGAQVDASSPGDANLFVFAGQACLITDPRQPNTCATTGAGNLTVTLDGHTATTATDGTFVIDAPQSSTIQWQVLGLVVITSVMSFSAVHRITVMAQVDYFDLANSNAGVPAPGQGDLFVHVVHQGASVAMVSAAVTPAAQFPTFYDGDATTTWTQISTSTVGVVWFFGFLLGFVCVLLSLL